MSERMETGVLTPNGDWPGIFIRGDNALSYAHQLRKLIAVLEERARHAEIPESELSSWSRLESLAQLLESCRSEEGKP